MSRSASPPNEWTNSEAEWTQADLASGTGLATAVSDVDIVIHTATNPQRSAAVDVEGTNHLIDHLREADIQQLLYISIVGIDTIPYSYYQHKLAAETAIMESDIPWTIQRATQFHTLPALVLQKLKRVPVWPLPTKFQFQPIAPDDVATHLCELVGDKPADRMPDIGGPEILRFGDLARIWADVHDLRRPTVRIPLPGRIANGFREGRNTAPDHRDETTTWRQWIEQRHTS